MAKPVTAKKDFNDIYVGDTDGAVTGDLLANDIAAPGQKMFLRFVDGIRVGDKGTNTIKGDYGSFTFYDNGKYTYKLDASNAAVKALGAGESLVEKVSYKISNGLGKTDFDYLDLTIHGPNVKPVAVKDSFDFDITGGNTYSNNVLTNDINAEGHSKLEAAFIYKDGLSAKVPYDGSEATLVGKYGTVSMHRDGTFDYVLDKNDADFVKLGVGAKATETFNYKIYDGSQSSNTTDYDSFSIHFTKDDLAP